MKLTDLEPRFLRVVDARHWQEVPTLAEAQGIRFLCPKCFVANGGRVGTHSIVCWSKSRGVADDVTPGPGRWLLVGTGMHDLTLDSEPDKSRSVLLTGDGCKWHGFVTNGEVTNA